MAPSFLYTRFLLLLLVLGISKRSCLHETATNELKLYTPEVKARIFHFKTHPELYSLEEKLSIRYQLISAYLIEKDYYHAIDFLKEAIKIAKDYERYDYITKLYLQKSDLEINFLLNEQSLESSKNAAETARFISDSTQLYKALSNKGKAQVGLGYFTASYHSFWEMYLIANALKDPELINDAENSLGAHYLFTKNIDSAQKYVTNVMRYEMTKNAPYGQAKAYGNMAYLYTIKDEFEHAKKYYDTSFYIAEANAYPIILMNLYKDRGEMYQMTGNFIAAKADFDKHYQLKDSLASVLNKNALSNWDIKWKLSEQGQTLLRNQLTELELRNQKNMYLIIGLASVFVLTWIVIVFRRRLNKSQQEKEILRKKSELEKVKLALHEKEIQIEKEKKERLKNVLAHQKKDLTQLALEVRERENRAEKIIAALQLILKEKDINRNEKLRELLAYVVSIKSTHKQLLSGRNVEIIGHEFTAWLEEKGNNLSKNDIYVCSLYRLGMSTKDIATLRGISFKSAEMTKYRIRKKLALERTESLEKFLIDFAGK